MKVLPFAPMVNSFSPYVPNNAKKVLADKKRYYLRCANILQESYVVYRSEGETGICFTMKDYGVRDIHQIGFTLEIETSHHTYTFQKTFTSVTYRNDNQFGIHVIDLQRIPITKCRLSIDWILYAGVSVQYQEARKIKIEEQFERPGKQDVEYMRSVDSARTECVLRAEIASSKKASFSEKELPTAWMVYPELVGLFSNLRSDLCAVKENHQTLRLNYDCDESQAELIPVPVSCYFDKGFYSTIFYAQNYPIVEKRLSGGKSALQCAVGVSKDHLDMLLYLFYCTIDQRKYYQYMTDEQISLQKYLEKNHPVIRLKNQLEEIAIQYNNSDIVMKSDVYQEAQAAISEYFESLKNAREDAYDKLVREKKTHGKWVNEYKLFTLIRVLFPDAQYQHTADWLEHQTVDIYIPSINCAIEYQGEQHYQAVGYFGGEEKLAEQGQMDEQKREKCRAHGITLLEWPYSLQIHMPSVCTFLRGSAPEELLSDNWIENQVAMFPIDSMSEFLNAPKAKRAVAPVTKAVKVNSNEIRKYDTAGKYIASYTSVSEAAEKEKLSIGGINKVIYGERKTAGGFQWKRCAIDSPKVDIAAIER